MVSISYKNKQNEKVGVSGTHQSPTIKPTEVSIMSGKDILSHFTHPGNGAQNSQAYNRINELDRNLDGLGHKWGVSDAS